ncbi:MAG: hypothetical protein ABL962_19975, partial [Fimbriimonadaceae bacterium]
ANREKPAGCGDKRPTQNTGNQGIISRVSGRTTLRRKARLLLRAITAPQADIAANKSAETEHPAVLQKIHTFAHE